MPVPVVKIKNLTSHIINLRSADGDSIDIMPKALAHVKLKFVDWQPPSPKIIFVDPKSLEKAKQLNQKHTAKEANVPSVSAPIEVPAKPVVNKVTSPVVANSPE